VRVRGFHRLVSRPVRGRGHGASPTLGGVAGPKTTVAEEALVQGPGDGGTGHHDDDGLDQQRSAARLRTPRCYPKGRDDEHAQRFDMRVTPGGTP
jgi:hypothetical protein